MSPTNMREEVEGAARLIVLALEQVEADRRRRIEEILRAAAAMEKRDDSWQFDVPRLCWVRSVPESTQEPA